MALPTSASTNWIAQRAGVRCMVYTTDLSCGVQLEISTASGAATSKWLRKRMLPSLASQVVHTFEVPFSTKQWFVRAKTWKLGQADSAYTTVGAVRPQLLNDQLPHPGHEARRIAQFGAFTTANSRTLRFPAPLGVLALTSQHGKIGANYFKPNTTNLSQTWYIPLAVPKGITLTAFKWAFLKKTSAASDVQLVINLLNATTGVTALATVVPSAGAGFQIFSAGMGPNLVPSSDSLVAKVTIKTSSVTTGLGAEHRWLDITYSQPNVSIGY